MFTRPDLDKLLEVVRIEDIAEEHLETRNSGRNIMACCPFHDERTPSFSINPQKQFFHCFGCGVSGDAIDLLMELDSLTFPEAVRNLSKQYNVRIKETFSSNEPKEEHDPVALIEINDKAKDFFTQHWHNKATEFFEMRNFDPGYMREHWGVGYVPDGRELLSYLKEEGVNEQELRLLGFISERGYPFFNNRLMWTLQDHLGRPVGFSARKLFEEDTYAKFVNSPETPVFKKQEILFGLFQNKAQIKEEHRAVICEGFTDVVAFSLAGVPAVSSSGTSITSQQVRRLARPLGGKGTVIVSMDGDKAGLQSSQRAIGLFTPHPMRLLGIQLPEGRDPEEIRRVDGDLALAEYVENATDLIDMHVQRHMPEDAEPETVRNSSLEMSKIISEIADPVLSQAWKKRIEKALNVSIPRIKQPLPRVKTTGLDLQLLSLAYHKPEVFEKHADELYDSELYPNMLPIPELAFYDSNDVTAWNSALLAMAPDRKTLLTSVPHEYLETDKSAENYLQEILKRLTSAKETRQRVKTLEAMRKTKLTPEMLENYRKTH